MRSAATRAPRSAASRTPAHSLARCPASLWLSRLSGRFASDAPLQELVDFVETDDDIATVARWSLVRADVQPPCAFLAAGADESALARPLHTLELGSRVLLLVRDDDA